MKNDSTLNNLIHKNLDNVHDDEFETENDWQETSEHSSVGPGKQIIANIMSYSRALDVVKTQSLGDLKFLMN